MSEANKQPYELEEESDLNEVFDTDDNNDLGNHDCQWINELRLALERGCDLGSIRNIGKCRPLIDDLRLSVWKVSEKNIFNNINQ